MIYVVGYGSLISHASLRKTIPDKHFIPVVVKGYKRVFDLAVKESPDVNVLNLERDKNSQFNGVLFEINDKELVTLKKRESLYDIEIEWTYDFLTGKKLEKAMVVVDYVVGIDHRKRLPNKKYFILCREAAYHISKDFGLMFDNTTFTSSGAKISNWLKTHKAYNTLKSRR